MMMIRRRKIKKGKEERGDRRKRRRNKEEMGRGMRAPWRGVKFDKEMKRITFLIAFLNIGGIATQA